jgi:hypothetical protein
MQAIGEHDNKGMAAFVSASGKEEGPVGTHTALPEAPVEASNHDVHLICLFRADTGMV